jgi:hypothetical protein
MLKGQSIGNEETLPEVVSSGQLRGAGSACKVNVPDVHSQIGSQVTVSTHRRDVLPRQVRVPRRENVHRLSVDHRQVMAVTISALFVRSGRTTEWSAAHND